MKRRAALLGIGAIAVAAFAGRATRAHHGGTGHVAPVTVPGRRPDEPAERGTEPARGTVSDKPVDLHPGRN